MRRRRGRIKLDQRPAEAPWQLLANFRSRPVAAKRGGGSGGAGSIAPNPREREIRALISRLRVRLATSGRRRRRRRHNGASLF